MRHFNFRQAKFSLYNHRLILKGGDNLFSYILNAVLNQLLYFALHIEGSSFPKPLSAKEEHECFVKMAEGDVNARNALVEHNLRLVAHIIKKYYSSSNNQDDLISIGTIGLIKAVESFDYLKGTRFATYASRCIENEILMHFRNLKKSSSDVYIGDAIDTDKDGNSFSFLDILADENNLADSIDLKLDSELLYQAVNKVLSDRERKVILYRYGLYGGRPMTQKETAKYMNISRSYVSRIEKKAIQLLRQEIKK